MNLFQLASDPIRLASGELSNFKIECDALTDADIACIAYLLVPYVEPFRWVEGVPTGGERLAQAMLPYVDKDSKDILLVDDVLTTGGSMSDYCNSLKVYKYQECPNFKGAVIFARGLVPDWIVPLFRMAR